MYAGSVWQQRQQAVLGMWYSKVPGFYMKPIDTVLNKCYCASSSLGCVKHCIECSVYETCLVFVASWSKKTSGIDIHVQYD